MYRVTVRSAVFRHALLVATVAGCGLDARAPAGVTSTELPDSDSASESSGTGSVEPEVLAVIDHALWSPVDPLLDPLASHRPEVLDCGPQGWFPEGYDLEANTGLCNYVGLVQPSLVHIPAGAQLELQMRYFDLVSPEPAEAHVALVVGDVVVWEKVVDLTTGFSPASVENPTWLAENEVSAGTPVHWHIHNHGENTWMLRSLTVQVPP